MKNAEVPAVIQALVNRPNAVEKIEVVYTFVHTCQGDRAVTCSSVAIDYRPSMVDPDDELPVTAIVIDDPDLGKGAHGSDNAADRRVTDELIDAMCITAGCKNGADCAKRRQKTT
ncbi:MAG: hypothetical protein AAB481_02740 [Patescibacteria group bacterium]